MSDNSGRFFSFANKAIDNKVKNEKLNCILKKIFNREILLYLLCGILTTVVNFVCYCLLYSASVKTTFFRIKHAYTSQT